MSKNNPDEIQIVWSVEDVYQQAEDDGLAKPTLTQAREILQRVKDSHDACIGISWETISAAIDEYFSEPWC